MQTSCGFENKLVNFTRWNFSPKSQWGFDSALKFRENGCQSKLESTLFLIREKRWIHRFPSGFIAKGTQRPREEFEKDRLILPFVTITAKLLAYLYFVRSSFKSSILTNSLHTFMGRFVDMHKSLIYDGD